ncbi:MAG: DegT/DnrJ/EryC1/StrS family aminotransferase [Candidatus Krumholzibacteriia bacterium]
MDRIHRVPFLDLNSQIEPIRSEIYSAIQTTIDASDFVLGPQLEAFESAFADYCGTRYAVGVSSGTDALYLTLRAIGVGPGDEVVTTPNMFIAAVEAIARTGATPVLVDVLEDTYCIDPEALESAVTDRTRAVIPVHLFGTPADMDPLMALAARRGFQVIEDACQAHGATYGGERVGAIGHAAAFSFYPTKNLGGFGDGGAITTDDPDIERRVRMLRHHAQSERNTHTEVGYNSRLDGIQAAVLKTKLPHLDRWNSRRRELALRYREGLRGSDYSLQEVPEQTETVYHVFAARHPRRELVHEQLDQSKVGYGRHIARPIHEQPGYRFLGYDRGAFPVSEKLCDEVVSLPIYPSMTEAQVDYVVDALVKVNVSV